VTSPFLERPDSDHVASNALAFALRDRYPVAPGHTLVIPRRLIATWFDATRPEQLALLELVDEVKRQLDQELRPDGYNVGFNAGVAAGQTVLHLHVHVIPRFRGDVDDPRGGVRHVIPGKGNYVATPPEPLATGGEGDPLSRHVLPLLARATDVAIVAAFVQQSGLDRIRDALHTALDRGARVRLVTGDYLDITQASALEVLLDWQSTWREPDEDDERPAIDGVFESRVVEVGRLPGRTRTFHPKSWHLTGPDFGVAFVGSSNLSRAALDTGIEWNLRVDRATEPRAWERVREAIDAAWGLARPLTAEWVEDYARRARARPVSIPPGEVELGPIPEAADPHEVQEEALAALRKSREAGRRRALVVLATGLGKTWLASFDYGQLWDELGRQPRLLFLAHRREILRQAARTFRRFVLDRGGDARIGWFLEEHASLDAHLVFASVAKLSRPAYEARLATAAFDYVVVDEVHHATATSYGRILRRVDPAFLLGLTATPDRADAADVLGLFDDHVAFTADIGRGVAVGRLVPFRYFGVKDDIDYQNLPWRNRRFDPEALAKEAQTEARMQTLWRAWQAHNGRRTLVFCCSVAHTDYVADWLRARGVRVSKVYAAPGSDDRDAALEALARGELDAVCAIDMFNEGVDVPAIDRVVMLRPTESGVVFLQQLGRGLRAAEGKYSLTVVDFVGNHHVFLDRLRTLLSLGSDQPGAALDRLLKSGRLELTDGCSVELELEAKPLLEALFRRSGVDEVERTYRQIRDTRGRRPTAGELRRMGLLPSTLQRRHGSWFKFVGGEGDLEDDERAAVEGAGAFLDELEVTELTKSYKLVTLRVLLDAEALASGLTVPELALGAWAVLRRSPELLRDVPEDHRLPDDPDEAAIRGWTAYWRSNPIQAWTGSKKRKKTWFRLDDQDRMCPAFHIDPAWSGALGRMVDELVDYRLAQYRLRTGSVDFDGFVCRVTWNQRDPILKLPPRVTTKVPEGDTDVRLADGSVWQFRFAAVYCNVARPVGSPKNQLPDLLRQWFGPRAGQPGTAFEVRFTASPDGLWLEPVQSNIVALLPRRGIVAYPDLRAAAGHAVGAIEPPDAARVWLPLEDASPDLFAVRVAGTSMDGGKSPLRDGDWAIFRLARKASAAAVAHRVVLIQIPDASGSAFQIKRVVPDGPGWRLISDNPAGPSLPAEEHMDVIAKLDRVVRPEELAPAVGTVLPATGLAEAFGLEGIEPRSGVWGGHRFVFVDQKGLLPAPDRLRVPGPQRPSETAFVLAVVEGGFRYLGVGRWRDDEGIWQLPEVDFQTWRAWGEGRDVSRPIPPGALARAQALADALLSLPEPERRLQRTGGRTARILGPAQRGGLRLDLGEQAASERTISLTDLAWVQVAQVDVDTSGGLLDEARVNRLRYLEGTPKGSTRWIDTGWALAAWARGRDLISREPSSPLHPVRDDGTIVDATFRLETLDGRATIVVEARGGAAGSGAETNTQYAEGLQWLLAQLKAAGLALSDAALDTRTTAGLPLEQRRLTVAAHWPLTIGDPAELQRRLGRAQEQWGKPDDAKGGNPTRRIRLWVNGADEAGLRQLLASG
jgi:superfamily II DNA or RNA helicase/diadenosine tetraphosphate (Ap4A) HIT family hydrolase/HKD family nuclease/SOS-response transcriptional repressor LexA